MDDNSTNSSAISTKILLPLLLVLQVGAIIWLFVPNHGYNEASASLSLASFISLFLDRVLNLIDSLVKLFFVACGILVATVIYALHVMQNNRIPKDERQGWVVGMLFGGPIVQAIYYLRCIAFPKQAAS
jgi:hypothetical protein